MPGKISKMKKCILSSLIMIVSQIILGQSFDSLGTQKIRNAEMQAHSQMYKEIESFAGSNMNVIYQRMEWTVNPSVNYIAGTVTTMFITVQDNISTLSFDMADNLNIGSILFHGTGLTFSHNSNILTVNLPNPL